MSDNSKEQPWQDEETLRDAYYRLGTQKEVADEFGCRKETIIRWMDRFDIETYRHNADSDLYDKEKLKSLYEETYSAVEVAERLSINTSPDTVRKWLRKFGVEISRSRGQTKIYTCENCGEEYERFASLEKEMHFCSRKCMREDFTIEGTPDRPRRGNWREVRRKVRERDGVCQWCGDASENRRLSVHHIKPLREFEDAEKAHDLNNLVALCHSCHQRIEHLPEKQQRQAVGQ